MRKEILSNGRIYHVYNRGVDKRKIFMEKADYVRFIHSLFEFNNVNCVLKSNVRFGLRNPSEVTASQLEQCLPSKPVNIREKREMLVKIMGFCLMPNHFHLILRQIRDDGISLFMQKLSGGYTWHFNKKYQRGGSLFQGPFRAIEVDSEPYLLQLSRYVHLNPLELVESGWKENGVKDWKVASEFLENYRWSSYQDYIGRKNFPSLTSREFLLGLFDDSIAAYKKFVREWAAEEMEDIEDLILED